VVTVHVPICFKTICSPVVLYNDAYNVFGPAKTGLNAMVNQTVICWPVAMNVIPEPVKEHCEFSSTVALPIAADVEPDPASLTSETR
jgi:hypothetical protein